MNTLPTSDAVLDALAKAIAEDVVMGGQPLFKINGWNFQSSYVSDDIWVNQSDKSGATFPATREGLIQALLFAGLQIEGGGE